MVSQRKVEALLDAQSAAGRKLLAKLRAVFRPALTKLGRDGWYSSELYVPVAQVFADRSAAAERARAAVTAKFTQAVLHELGDDVRPALDLDALRGDVDPLEVWQRPMKEYRWQVSQGKSPEEALSAAVGRAESIADDNLQLASRKASQDVMAASAKTIGWRRVIRPELSKGGTCGLCIAASTRKYRVEELRAIHENCGCETVPITEDDDLGDVLNTYDLKKLYADNDNSTDSDKLKYTRYQVDVHGELGPVLRRKGDNFRDAKDVAHDGGRPPTKTRDQAIAELQALLRARPVDPLAVKAKKREIARLNRAA